MKLLALTLCIPLATCTPEQVATVVDIVYPTVSKAVAKGYCQKIKASYELAAVNGAQIAGCKAVVRTAAIVNATRSICANVDGMTAVQLVDAVEQVRAQWKNASVAAGSGC